MTEAVAKQSQIKNAHLEGFRLFDGQRLTITYEKIEEEDTEDESQM